MIIFSKTQKKGVTTSWYLIIYGVVRFVLEQFRDPAELLTIGNTGLRVSQVLSFVLIVLGVVLYILALKYKDKNKTETNKENIK